MTYQPMSQEALSAALAAVQGSGVSTPHPGAPDPAHTVQSPVPPTMCACGEPVHRGTAWVQTGPEGGDEEFIASMIANGIPPHCGMCGRSLGVVQTEEQGRARYYAHLPYCPAADKGLRESRWG